MNFLGGISTTGGTSTLTISQGLGLALPALAVEDDEEVCYSIVERTSSSDRTIVQSETGVGNVSSANVLTRTNPRVTWVASGPTYDQDGSVSALNFATSNVEIYIGPLADATMGTMTQRARVVTAYGYGPDEWIIPTNYSDSTDFSTHTLAANVLLCAPIKIEQGFVLSTLGVKVTTAQATKLISVAIASVTSDNGIPGRILACANGLSLGSTGIVSASVTARMIRPGWYYALFNADSSTAIVRGSASPLPNFLGSLASNERTIRHWTRSRTYASYTLGDDAMSGSSGSPAGVANVGTPILLMR